MNLGQCGRQKEKKNVREKEHNQEKKKIFIEAYWHVIQTPKSQGRRQLETTKAFL